MSVNAPQRSLQFPDAHIFTPQHWTAADDSSPLIDSQAAAGNTDSRQSIAADLSRTLPEYRVKFLESSRPLNELDVSPRRRIKMTF